MTPGAFPSISTTIGAGALGPRGEGTLPLEEAGRGPRAPFQTMGWGCPYWTGQREGRPCARHVAGIQHGRASVGFRAARAVGIVHTAGSTPPPATLLLSGLQGARKGEIAIKQTQYLRLFFTFAERMAGIPGVV